MTRADSGQAGKCNQQNCRLGVDDQKRSRRLTLTTNARFFRSGIAALHRVALVGVDDEQLAAGLIFPPEPEIAAERAVASSCTAAARSRTSAARTRNRTAREQRRREIAGGQLRHVDRDARLDRPLLRQRRRAPPCSRRRNRPVVEVRHAAATRVPETRRCCPN